MTSMIRTGANVKRRRASPRLFMSVVWETVAGAGPEVKFSGPCQAEFTGRCPGSRSRGGRLRGQQRLPEGQGREIFSSSSCFKICQISKCAGRRWLKFGTKRNCNRHIVANLVPPKFSRKGKFKKPATHLKCS